MNQARNAYIRGEYAPVLYQLVPAAQPYVRPDQATVGPKYTRAQCTHSEADVAAFLAGTLQRLGSWSQEQLRILRRLDSELARAQAALADLDEQIDRAEIRRMRKQIAFLTAERDWAHERARLFLSQGDVWGAYDRACRVNDRRNELLSALPEHAAGGYAATLEQRDAIARELANLPYALYAQGVIAGDDALRAYASGGGMLRSKCEQAVTLAKAGLEVRVV